MRRTSADLKRLIKGHCNKIIQSLSAALKQDGHNKEMLKFLERELFRIVICLTIPPIRYVDLSKDKGGRGTQTNPIGWKAFNRQIRSGSEKEFKIKGYRKS